MVFKIKKTFWAALFALAAGIIVFSVSSAAEEKDDFTALMYHHLVTDKNRVNDYCLCVSDFENDLIYLKANGYVSLLPSDIEEIASGKKALPQKAVMLTFDDGQESFYKYAYPLLQKYGFTATLAVVGDFADEYTKNECHDVAYSCCNWDEINEMSQSGIVYIANHTQSMHIFRSGERKGVGKLAGEREEDYKNAILTDISAMQENIRLHTGNVCDVFVYPFGKMSDTSNKILKEAGFKMVYTCASGKNTLKNGDGFIEIGRCNRLGGVKSEEFLPTVL